MRGDVEIADAGPVGQGERDRRFLAALPAPGFEDVRDRTGAERVAHGGRYGLPVWTIEGMAQYLSLGAGDSETAMWLRDAVRHDLLPRRADAATRKFRRIDSGTRSGLISVGGSAIASCTMCWGDRREPGSIVQRLARRC